MRALWIAALIAGLADPLAASLRYDSSLRFRTLTTSHFVIHFHQGEERLASRVAVMAEQVHETLGPRLTRALRGRTHVILVDQSDQASGWATPVPRDTIELSAAWPAPTEAIGNTDDWLALVFVHEYAHLLHVSQSAGWASGLRHVFGRVPLVFPNLFLPQWQVEGFATYQESRLTGRGRVPAGDFRMLVGEAARSGRLEPIDRVNGGLVDWPSATTPYAYGAYFHQYLAERSGDTSLGDLGRRTAGRVPYTGGGAFSQVFGESLERLWLGFAAASGPSASGATPAHPAATRLTSHGFVVSGPRFVPASASARPPPASSEPPRVVYSVRNPHGFPSLLSTGLGQSEPAAVVTRFGGDHVSMTTEAIYFDQLELTHDVALTSDLYAADRATGRVTRLSHGARLADPDVSPDGRVLACVAIHGDRRELAEFDVATRRLRVLVSQADVHFSSPRWSPDGRFVAAARQALNGQSDIVVVDAQSGEARVVTSTRLARNATPAWTPDGRTVLFASDRDGPFNLYAVDLDTGPAADLKAGRLWRLTQLPGGATFPDVSPDGRLIVYVGYTTDGFDLFTMPLDRSAWSRVEEPEPSKAASLVPAWAPGQDGALDAVQDARAYQPMRTLGPTAWQPVVALDGREMRVGASISGADVLGRHWYTLSGVWLTCRGCADEAPARPEWYAAYVYDRRLPTFFLTASREMSRTSDQAGSDALSPAEHLARDANPHGGDARALPPGSLLPGPGGRRSATSARPVRTTGMPSDIDRRCSSPGPSATRTSTGIRSVPSEA